MHAENAEGCVSLAWCSCIYVESHFAIERGGVREVKCSAGIVYRTVRNIVTSLKLEQNQSFLCLMIHAVGANANYYCIMQNL